MYERVGISLIEVYGRVGKSVILVCKKALGLTDAFHFFLLGGGEGLPDNGLTFYSGEGYQTPTLMWVLQATKSNLVLAV